MQPYTRVLAQCCCSLLQARRIEDCPKCFSCYGWLRRKNPDAQQKKFHSRLVAPAFSPQKPFDEGLRETVEWYREGRAWWEPIKSGEYRAYYERQYAERLASSTSL